MADGIATSAGEFSLTSGRHNRTLRLSPRQHRLGSPTARTTGPAGKACMRQTALREPWTDIRRQREAATFAMWLFIATEILFFGALFAAYAVYRSLYGSEFLSGARHTEIAYGAANTA